MTFDTFARLLRQRLTKLGYKIMVCEFSDLFYIENYYDAINLFKIDYNSSYFQYAASPQDISWTSIYDFSSSNLKKLYVLSKKYYIDAKEKKIKNKLNEINKDFE